MSSRAWSSFPDILAEFVGRIDRDSRVRLWLPDDDDDRLV